MDAPISFPSRRAWCTGRDRFEFAVEDRREAPGPDAGGVRRAGGHPPHLSVRYRAGHAQRQPGQHRARGPGPVDEALRAVPGRRTMMTGREGSRTRSRSSETALPPEYTSGTDASGRGVPSGECFVPTDGGARLGLHVEGVVCRRRATIGRAGPGGRLNPGVGMTWSSFPGAPRRGVRRRPGTRRGARPLVDPPSLRSPASRLSDRRRGRSPAGYRGGSPGPSLAGPV